MSAAGVSRSFPLPSPLKLDEDASMVTEKQGIGTILGSDSQLNKVASLRRTLSADMSSKKWLAQNGFSPMKRIASSEELAAATDNGDGDGNGDGDQDKQLKNMPCQDEVWRSIQSGEMKKAELKKTTSQPFNVWSSILAEKSNNDSKDLPPPYIHPLVRRSASTLSEKSLEICTESLGSETGSDSLPASCPTSETEDTEEDTKEDAQQQVGLQQQGMSSYQDMRVAKYNYNPSKRLPPRNFPPPLPSLARGDGPSLHMHSHRKNGRLVLEAVSVPQKNYFRAERQYGRLLLSLVDGPTSKEPRQEETEDEDVEFEQVFDNFEEVESDYEEQEEEEEEEEEEEGAEDQEEEDVEKEMSIKEMAFVVEKSTSLPSGGINVARPALMMKRLMRIGNKDPTWSNELNKAVNLMEVDDLTPVPQSLPPAPRVARLIPSPSALPPPPSAEAPSFNAYEYFWKKNPTVASIIDPVSQRQCTPLKAKTNCPKGYDNHHKQQQKQDHLVLLRGNKADYLVPLLSGCKDRRRSLLIWQPYCIATS